jgi:hypothetical protein
VKLCHRASRVITDILQQWRDLYTLRLVPVILLHFVFTAGSTWLIAVSERSHKRSTSEQYLRNAEQCIEMLKEMSQLWESADILANMFTRLVINEREKRRNEEEKWMITEVGPSGNVNSSGSVHGGISRWESSNEIHSGLPIHSNLAGGGIHTSRDTDSYSSEEEGARVHHQQHLHTQVPTQQNIQQSHPYQQHPIQTQVDQPMFRQPTSHNVPAQETLLETYNLPPLAKAGPSGSSVLQSMNIGYIPSSLANAGLLASVAVSGEPELPRLDKNDAINGLKRTGVWMNPPT